MSDGSSIEWTDATWNPTVGCTRVSAGCDNCYAVRMTRLLEGISKAPGPKPRVRLENYRGLVVLNRAGRAQFNGVVRTVPESLDIPLRWRTPRRVFVNSMSDLFHPAVPFEFVDRVFAVMALTPHTYQILTKRPERMAEYLDGGAWTRTISAAARVRAENDFRPTMKWDNWPLPNVWLGTSVEDQAAADERIPHLLHCPAAVRFLSCEPLLGAIDLTRLPFIEPGVSARHKQDALTGANHLYSTGINGHPDMIVTTESIGPSVGWVIVGGESGPHARPCDVGWIRGVVEQCRAAAVPVFVKQLWAHCYQDRQMDSAWTSTGVMHMRERLELQNRKGGDWDEWPEDLRVREFPKEQA